jgi:hypothetical protein
MAVMLGEGGTLGVFMPFPFPFRIWRNEVVQCHGERREGSKRAIPSLLSLVSRELHSSFVVHCIQHGVQLPLRSTSYLSPAPHPEFVPDGWHCTYRPFNGSQNLSKHGFNPYTHAGDGAHSYASKRSSGGRGCISGDVRSRCERHFVLISRYFQ